MSGAGLCMETSSDRYDRLVERVDALIAPLFDRYRSQLRCRRGCYFCCDEITVLPIEIHALRRYVAENGIPDAAVLCDPPAAPAAATDPAPTPPDAPRAADRTSEGSFAPPGQTKRRCAFLGRDGTCTVYAARPLICRTHGLPLAYRVYEYDADGLPVHHDSPELMDLWCDLNFTEVSDRNAKQYFDQHGRVNMAAINEELEALNGEFLKSEAGKRFGTEDRMVLGAATR